MPARHFPVRPNLDQLKHQAKDLLRDARRGDAEALADVRAHHPKPPAAEETKLAHAQHALARSYGLASWPRLVLACRLTDAICRDDADAVRDLVTRQPELLGESARGVPGCNWGPPMSYAANLGRGRIVAMLRELGAADLQFAFDRACLQGQLDTARQLHALGARPVPGSVMGPAETQNAHGLALLLELGATIGDEHGNRLAPVAMLLETYTRNPAGKHGCLEIFERHGVALPHTAPMAVHRGRVDLLDQLLRGDPSLLDRTFTHAEIYPPELGCNADPAFALCATPVTGGTLLHLCVDYGELAIARRLLERGADANARARVDADGFGGHTALFGCAVSQPYRCSLPVAVDFTRLLLDHGADPNARASLRKQLIGAPDEKLYEYRDVTPLAWGKRFHDQDWVDPAALALLAERGARE